MTIIKQKNVSIYSPVKINTILVDKRLKYRGIIFGTVSQVASQYGVKTDKIGKYIKFTAPKSRLQLFAEKLHFSGVAFSEKYAKL